MHISAVIPTKNRTTDLIKAVESILRQSRLPDELLVIDQSDDAESKRQIYMLVSGYQNFKLQYVYDPGITGLIDAKREATSRAKGDVICFLEDDVILEPDYFSAMHKVFKERPEVMGCCGVVTNLPRLPKNYVRFFHFFHRGIFQDTRVGIHGHPNNTGLIPSNYLSGGTSAYRREVFERVPFDLRNDFFMLEDIDFSVRAVKEYGAEHFFINTSAKLAHMMSPINRAKLLFRYQRKLKEFICFYKKHRSNSKFALFDLYWLLVGLLVEAFCVAIKNRSSDPLKGWVRGVIEGATWRIREVPTPSIRRNV